MFVFIPESPAVRISKSRFARLIEVDMSFAALKTLARMTILS